MAKRGNIGWGTRVQTPIPVSLSGMTRTQIGKAYFTAYRRNVRRVTNIEKKFGKSFATESFRRMNLAPSIKGKSMSEINKMFRDLRYFENLKTGSVKGVQKFKTEREGVVQGIFNRMNVDINVFGEDFKSKFFEIYGKIYEENPNIGQDNFKYEAWDIIDELLTSRGEPQSTFSDFGQGPQTYKYGKGQKQTYSYNEAKIRNSVMRRYDELFGTKTAMVDEDEVPMSNRRRM